MSLQRSDGSEPLRVTPVERLAPVRDHRRSGVWRLGVGTLACPSCDVPVAPAGRRLAPAQRLDCPMCGHTAAVRDFLSLAAPTRPARVDVRVIAPAVRAGPSV